MKNAKLNLSIAFILFATYMQAADYCPFVEEGKVWHMHHFSDYFPEYNYDFDYFIQGDTLIAGIEARKVYSINEGNNGTTTYKMALYESNKKVFFIPSGSEQQYVLYDFNCKVGNEVTVASVIGEAPENITMKILADKIINIHNINRHAYLMRWAGAPLEDTRINSGWWIEGIGSVLGPFNTWRFGFTGIYEGLTICEVNGQIIYESLDWIQLDNEYWKGDVNSDGVFDVEDVNAAINIILKLKTMDDYPGNADLDGNGIVDVEDVNILINKILKLE